MPKTEFTPSIDSRPVYPGLVSHGAAPAIMVADAEGAEALIELADRDASVMDRAAVIYLPKGREYAGALKVLGPRQYHEAPDLDAAHPLLARLFADAHMGTHLYLAGTEGLIAAVGAMALAAGFPADAIETEHRGSVARRMQCVHCKGITEDVTTDPFRCADCGLTLFVRDHFSRRLGVFQGVCVDAETPGIVPETQEIRP